MGKKITTEEFKIRVALVHPLFYNFDQVEYISAKIKVKVICQKHGDFYATPDNLMQGKGCKLCGYESNSKLQTKSFQDFVDEAKKLYGDKYLYNKENYLSSQRQMSIFCTVHHRLFKVTPSAHIRGRECKLCGTMKSVSSKRKYQQSKIIERFTAVHGDAYDYSLLEYQAMRTKVSIICKMHDMFSITPHNHLNGQGCPKCSIFGYNKSKAGLFYVLSYKDIIKVGITNRDIHTRIKEINRSFNGVFKEAYSVKGTGESVYKLEKDILIYLSNLYRQPSEIFQGSTECFYGVNLPHLINTIEENINAFN